VGNALGLVVFLGLPLGIVFLFYDADATHYLPAIAVASASPAKEICRRRDHQRRIRGKACEAPAGCKHEIASSTWVLQARTCKTGGRAWNCAEVLDIAHEAHGATRNWLIAGRAVSSQVVDGAERISNAH
jgi:hypothetical protein